LKSWWRIKAQKSNYLIAWTCKIRKERNAWKDMTTLKRKRGVRRIEETILLKSIGRRNNKENEWKNSWAIRQNQIAWESLEKSIRCS